MAPSVCEEAVRGVGIPGETAFGQRGVACSDERGPELVGVRRTDAGAEIAYRLPIGGRMSSNLALVRLADGSLIAGAGSSDEQLRIWLP